MVQSKKEKGKVGSKVSQLRQDIVTGDWVVIAMARKKRPDDFKIGEKRQPSPVEGCLFCDPEKTGQEKDLLIYKTSAGDWTLRVFPNKYPAFSRVQGGRLVHQEEGPYFWMDGIGYHELIVTRDHEKHMGNLETLQIAEVFDAYQTRYLDLMNKKSVRYIEIFHNHGSKAGASIAHPHSQLVAMPVISPYITGELSGAEQYYKSNKKCPYCSMVEWESEVGSRLVFENDRFIAFCPFASRAAFEVWVMPKKHSPYFERLTDEDKIGIGEAMGQVLKKMDGVLGDPDYNFYLHTAPCDGKDYDHFHWHVEILPKTSIWAGFELSTGIEISTILPEDAAKYLKKA